MRQEIMSQLASIFLLQPVGDDVLWEQYHANTKLSPAHMPPAGNHDDPVAELNDAVRRTAIQEIEFAVATGGKRYATTAKVALPQKWPDGFNASLAQALEARSSCREYSEALPDLETISGVCRAACGLKPGPSPVDDAPPSRCVPSAGALYPLELYLFLTQPLDAAVPYPEGTVWHYDPQGHCLERVARCEPSRIMECFQTVPEVFPPLVAVLTGVPRRQTWKYGARAYRYTVMEAGHAVQNMLLAAAVTGLGACPVVGFYDDRIHNLLDVDGVGEIALYTVWIGHPADSGDLTAE